MMGCPVYRVFQYIGFPILSFQYIGFLACADRAGGTLNDRYVYIYVYRNQYIGYPVYWVSSILGFLHLLVERAGHSMKHMCIYIWGPSIFGVQYIGFPMYLVFSILGFQYIGFPVYWVSSILGFQYLPIERAGGTLNDIYIYIHMCIWFPV